MVEKENFSLQCNVCTVTLATIKEHGGELDVR
jgi:hypothetical protein